MEVAVLFLLCFMLIHVTKCERKNSVDFQKQEDFKPMMPPVFVPSPPGKIPNCARPGLTFCENIVGYPVDLIATLAANSKTLFDNEDMTSRKAESHTTIRFNKENSHYPLPSSQLHATYNTLNNFNQSSQQEGYSGQQNPFDESRAHLVDPVLHSSFRESSLYNPNDWWKNQTGSKRKQKQSLPGIELCPTRSQFIEPHVAVNSRGDWKYVVNVRQGGPEQYTQMVRSEICMSEHQACDGICSLPNGYTSRCEQKYVVKRLVALDGTGQLGQDVFWFPHGCECQIQTDANARTQKQMRTKNKEPKRTKNLGNGNENENENKFL